MRVTPMSEQELQESNLIPEGIYPFDVTDAKETYSKKGNEMIRLTIVVYDSANRKHVLDDFLLDAMPFKVRHFCEYTGLIDRYNAGELSSGDCYKKSGWAKISIETGRPKPDGGEYPPRNSVKDYCEKPVDAVRNGASGSNGTLPFEDIPF